MADIQAIEDEIEKLDHVIKAAEDWSKQYDKDPVSYAGIIKVEAKLERNLRGYFRDLAEKVVTWVDWAAYEQKLRQIQADDLEVIVRIEDGPLGDEDGLLVQAIYDPIAAGTALGAQSGEVVYQINLGLSETSAAVQKAAREQVAQLVGKKVGKDGVVTVNPNAKYAINNKTKEDIRESIRTSLSIGETQQEAADRLSKTIKNPKRAATIARTETVNAYQQGLLVMADQSGAVGKEWLTVNGKDICGVYGDAGIVPIDHVYNVLTGLKAPAAHPNCRCSLRLVYANEVSQKL